jgi:hypothetical protein
MLLMHPYENKFNLGIMKAKSVADEMQLTS